MVRRNRAEYAPKAGEKAGLVHEDLLMINRPLGEQLFRAIDFDNEEHVIRYTVSFPSNQRTVVFDSEVVEKSPRFRLIDEMATGRALSVEFLVAPPGGELKSYTKGIAKRQQ